MIGSFLTRGLVMAFGYAYPAYKCFKTLEMNKPEIENLRFWCQYWILVAGLTIFERIGDIFISWLPMYFEVKLALFVYLWYPKTRGTIYVYDSFLRPYVAKHETEIDRYLMELKIKARDLVVCYCQRTVSYGQTRIFEILYYVVSQASSNVQLAQQAEPQGPSFLKLLPPPQTTHSPSEPSTSPSNTPRNTTKKPNITSMPTINQQESTEEAEPSTKQVGHNKESSKQGQPEDTSHQNRMVERKASESNTTSTLAVKDENTNSSVPKNTNSSSPKLVLEEELKYSTRGRFRKTRAPQ